ncbi:unnamed protein product [Cylicostephanus goldi]|uniref:Ras-associating domain-containing protein n=1 Tax=Cylicostephanus goldi TaxID=71465 RepID=A0A3P7MHL5_CYLGO|nr:unnamed protein product [Cylicostephanus goldi]
MRFSSSCIQTARNKGKPSLAGLVIKAFLAFNGSLVLLRAALIYMNIFRLYSYAGLINLANNIPCFYCIAVSSPSNLVREVLYNSNWWSICDFRSRAFIMLKYQGTLRVYTSNVKSCTDYKTIRVSTQCTTRSVIGTVLGKFKISCKDVNLFELWMEVNILLQERQKLESGHLGHHQRHW